MEPDVRLFTETEICAVWGYVVIRICDGVRTEVEDLDRVAAIFDELLEQRRHIGVLLVFAQGTPVPTLPTQRYAAEQVKRYGDRVVTASALLGLGFWASAVRGAFATLLSLDRSSPVSLHGSVDEAIARLGMELIGLDTDALASVYEQLAARLHERAA